VYTYVFICILDLFSLQWLCFAETLNFDRRHLTCKCYFKMIFTVVYFIRKIETAKFVDP